MLAILVVAGAARTEAASAVPVLYLFVLSRLFASAR